MRLGIPAESKVCVNSSWGGCWGLSILDGAVDKDMPPKLGGGALASLIFASYLRAVAAAQPMFCDILNAAYNGNLNVLKGFFYLGLPLSLSWSEIAELVAEFGHGREEQAKGLMGVKDPKGRTALHCAAGRGKTHVCKYLVEQLKIDVNVKDDEGYTPLHTSVLDGQYLTSVYVLDHGAQPNAADERGLTPLHCAAEIGRQEQLHLLISKGAEVDAQSLRGTPLQCAAADGMKNAVKMLLDNHANPNSVSQQMQTPLVLAILANSIDCARLLLKAGADPNMGSHGITPLVVAVCEGQTEIIKCLLKAGADPNYDFTPLEMAAMRGRRADVRYLLQATTPIPGVPDWSVDGILDYVKSAEAENQACSQAPLCSDNPELNGSFMRRKQREQKLWQETIISRQFTGIQRQASTAKPKDAAVYSNRSLCWARMNDGNNALKEAMICIMLRPDWPKACYRVGVAWRLLQNYEKAVAAFDRGLMLDPENKDLQDAKR
ncbi:hypothetical protein Cgig2_021538 [Carnegiea gigantea]|uniref:Uncharacterized protein n=1 Tax=Carnegiea gigantea TaxID=171969 RepID=A0A9Q1KEG5_9CARY|nr:hypothetical protein Cgig2_021538 [Carnegiea gigantea]